MKRGRSQSSDYVVTERKVRLYPAVHSDAQSLRNTPIWNSDREPVHPRPRYDDLRRVAEQIAFFSSDQVNAALDTLLITAAEFVDAITAIHQDNRPNLHGAIYLEFWQDHHRTLARLDHAIDSYVTAARAELGITGPWRALGTVPH